MILKCKENSDYVPHPEGIHPAVCVDVIDLGMVDVKYGEEEKTVHKLRLVFETEEKMEDGRNFIVSKKFTASLHPKANLNKFISTWRGKTIHPDEEIELEKLIGVSCVLVISHQELPDGKVYASIDAVSKPTKKLTPSGGYDLIAAHARAEERKKKTAVVQTKEAVSKIEDEFGAEVIDTTGV